MHSQHYKIQFFVEMHANSLSSAASQVQTVYLAEMVVSINYYLSSANTRNGRLSLLICNVFGNKDNTKCAAQVFGRNGCKYVISLTECIVKSSNTVNTR